MLELTQTHSHLKVDGECQVVETTTGATRRLVCVVESPTDATPMTAEPGVSSELTGSVAMTANSVRQWMWAWLSFGFRFVGRLVLTGIGCVGAVVVAGWLMLLWPLIAELFRLLGMAVFYASGFSGRALSNCLLRAGNSLYARSHVAHAGGVLYAWLSRPRAGRLPRGYRAVLPAKVER